MKGLPTRASPDDAPAFKPRPWMVGALFAAGLGLWYLLEQAPPPRPQLWPVGLRLGARLYLANLGVADWAAPYAELAAALLLAAVCATPWIRRGTANMIARVRNPSPATRRWTTLAITATAALYLCFTALRQGRDFFTRIEDENAYLIQTQMMARAQLWMPAHPMGDFFESFHVLTRPVYCSIYFPGTALAYAPLVWLHLTPTVLTILMCAAVVGMTYRLIAELVDGAAGLLAAMLMLACWPLRYLSLMVISHPLLALQGMLLVWAWLHWRRSRSRLWLALMGIMAGWAAVTRPLDGLCYALPVMAALLADLRPVSWSARWSALGLIALFAAPLLSLQFIMNKGVTGDSLRTPTQLEHQLYWPQMSVGLLAGPADAPRTAVNILPQFEEFYRDLVVPQAEAHAGESFLDRAEVSLEACLPSHLLAILLPLGLLGLTDRRRWAFFAVFPLFLASYWFYLFFYHHYQVVVAPVLVFLVVLAPHALRNAFPRAKDFWDTYGTLLIGALALAGLPELSPLQSLNGLPITDAGDNVPVLQDVNRQLSQIAQNPSVVLFHFHPEVPDLWRQEPVYNIDAAWPDDARVIRAHDLGPRNIELVRYYASLQPQRVFYWYDLKTMRLTELGSAGDLAAHPDVLAAREAAAP